MKTDAKIDMLHQSGLFGKGPSKMKARQSDITEDMEEEEEVELSMSTVSLYFCRRVHSVETPYLSSITMTTASLTSSPSTMKLSPEKTHPQRTQAGLRLRLQAKRRTLNSIAR